MIARGSFDARRAGYAAFLSLVFSGTVAGGINNYGYDQRVLDFLPSSLGDKLGVAAIDLLVFFAHFVVAGLILYWLFQFLPKLVEWARGKNPLPKVSLAWGLKPILVAACIIFVCYIPWMILQYPCAMNMDAYNQLYQWRTDAPMYYTTMGYVVDAKFIDHHPIFDTLIYGLCIDFGDAIGSQNVSLFLLSLIQCALTAICLSVSVCYLEKMGVPKVFRLVALLFCALFFPIPAHATCMVKDSLFTPLFVVWMVLFIDVVRTEGKSCQSLKFVVSFVALGVLCGLTKKTGMYVCAASVLVLLVAYRAYWKQLLAALVLPVLVVGVFIPKVVFPLANVEPGGVQEMLGCLFQQSVTAVIEHPDEVTAEERAAIDKVINLEKAIQRYDPVLVDGVKNRYRHDTATSQDLVEYAKTWAEMGLRFPGTYINSLLRVGYGSYAPIKPMTYYSTPIQTDSWIKTLSSHEGDAGLTFTKPAAIDGVSKKVENILEHKIVFTGPFYLLFTHALYVFWLPLFCAAYALYARPRKGEEGAKKQAGEGMSWLQFLLVMVPVAASFAFIVISPASGARYALPFVYVAPLVTGAFLAMVLQQVVGGEKEDQV